MMKKLDQVNGLLSGLKDEDIERSWEEAHADARAAKKKHAVRIMFGVLAAAALAAVIGIVVGIGQTRKHKGSYDAFTGMIAELSSAEIQNTENKDAAYVPLGDRIAAYYRLESGERDLSAFTGDFVANGPSAAQMAENVRTLQECLNSCDCGWYQITGARNRQYLLRKDVEGALSVWEFGRLMSIQEGLWRSLFPEAQAKETEYGFRERLEVLFCVADVQDLARVEAFPSTLSAVVPATELQQYAKEIGTKTIDDPEEMNTLFTLLRNLRDVPMTMEEAPDHVGVFCSEQIRTNVETCYLKGLLGPLTRYERQIRLVFSDGSSEVLRYSAVSGRVSYDGTRCMELNESDYAAINTLLGIDTKWSLPAQFGEESGNAAPAGDPAGLSDDYDAGSYETPAGTPVVCIKYGGEVYEEELISARRADHEEVRVRFVKYSLKELKNALQTLSGQLRDQGSASGYGQGILAFGISEIYNRINVYCACPEEADAAAIGSFLEDPGMIQIVGMD